MSTYTVTLTAQAVLAVTVEADSLDDAELAAYAAIPALCDTCAGWGEDWQLKLGGFDLDTVSS